MFNLKDLAKKIPAPQCLPFAELEGGLPGLNMEPESSVPSANIEVGAKGPAILNKHF